MHDLKLKQSIKVRSEVEKKKGHIVEKLNIKNRSKVHQTSKK